MDELIIHQVNIEELKPADYNPRKWSETARRGLTESLDTFGFVQPIVANSAPERRGVIIGGNFKLNIAKEKGLKTVPVVWVNIPDLKKEKELNLRLNKNQGEFDNDLLSQFDEDMLKQIGWDSKDLDKIFDEDKDDDFDAEEEVKKIVEPTTKLGDIFQLGRHRLICGDATNTEDVKKLTGGVQVDMVFCDPPYGVSYVGKTKDALEIKNDKLLSEELLIFLSKSFSTMFEVLKQGGSWYVAGPAGQPYNMIFNRALEHHNWKHTLVWVKQTFVMGRADYHYKHEIIYYGWKEGAPHYFIDDRTKDTVWEKEPTDEEIIKWFRKEIKKTDVWKFKKPARNKEHPTMKPIGLCQQAIRNSSKRGEIILDLFGGSGSTLVAADQVSRTCYMSELDPKYCDVIIKRWEKLNGEKAVKI